MSVPIMIVIGSLCLLAIALIITLFIAAFYKKQDLKRTQYKLSQTKVLLSLVKASVQASEREKERIARNLHDEINPMISILKRNLEHHSLETNSDLPDTKKYESDYVIIDKIADGLRCISNDLVPSFMLKFGLIKSLNDYLNHINETNRICTSFEVETPNVSKVLWLKEEEMHIYRMCLEIIQNILKHAEGTYLQLKMKILQSVLTIEIRHNGNGVTDKEVNELITRGKGLGLKSLQARALILHANLNYIKNPDHFLVNLTIPRLYE